MKKAFIFDLDGTLVDTPSGIVKTFKAVLNERGINNITASQIRTTVGRPLEKSFGELMGVDANSKEVTDAIQQYQAFFKQIVLPIAKELVFPGVIEGLEQLKDQGKALAVATSKYFSSAENLLKAADLLKYFDVVVGADQVTNPKPHPEMGFLVLEKLTIRAEEAIMVGDTTHDILMANDSGIASLAVTYGVQDIEKLQSAHPTWIAHSFDEAMEIMLLGNKKDIKKVASNTTKYY